MSDVKRKLRIAVISSFSRSLTNFRLELLKRMASLGHEVLTYGPERDDAVIQTLSEIGVSFQQLPMARTGTNPIADFGTLKSLVSSFRQYKPDVVLAYTMKPIIYGGLAARIAGVENYYAMITGLGHVFAEPEPKGKAAVLRKISVFLYRHALKKAKRVFVYNQADRQDIERYALVASLENVVDVPGSGVDLDHFAQKQVPRGEPVFLLVARLLRDKGIHDFVEAARTVKQKHPEVQAQLLGQFEPHNSGIAQVELDDWQTEGVVSYLGEVRDVRPFLSNCSVFVLPSYYREGVPRSILEAMAVGRAIITADTPGCRDTVEEGKNGFIVPAKDPIALAKAMLRFVEDPSLASQMGQNSRSVASTRYDVHSVNRQLLDEMELTGSNS
jgi:glycosyltransferase involved in cell wall biosynthesis